MEIKKLILTLLFVVISSTIIYGNESNRHGKIIINFKTKIEGYVSIECAETHFSERVVIDSGKIEQNRYIHEYSIERPEFAYLVVYDDQKRIVGYISIINPFYNREIIHGDVYLDNSEIEIEVLSFDKRDNWFHAKLVKSPENMLLLKLHYDEREANKYVNRNGTIFNYEIIREFKDNKFLPKYIFDNITSYTLDSIKGALSIMDKEIKNSYYGIKIQEYLKKQTELDKKGIKKNFDFIDINDNRYRFADFIQNKKYGLLIFWASWCIPCRAEIPQLNQLYEKYSDKVSFASLSIDKNKKAWQEAVKESNVKWHNLSGFQISNTYVFDLFAVIFVPSFVIVDDKGNIILNTTSNEYFYIKDLDNFLKSLTSKSDNPI
jgi:thiol-disulfide isomerase/thioredoxin